ncbi:DUF5105 domain-containing protein [Gudongella sp. SC589]|uniref:DUF5105 domain-containing protein n=1 Tax=Gudongella sp. SC589 TaxID=3385990 RepID=UPI003904AEA0
MRRWLSLVLVFVLVFTLTGCSGESPEQAVTNAIEAIKDMDQEELSKYIEYDELINTDDSTEMTEQEEEQAKSIFKNLEYEIKSSTEDGNTAVVNAEITNIDMGIVFSEMFMEMFSRAFEDAFSSDPMTEEESDEMMQELMTELMEKHKDNTVTNTVAIKLNKVDNQWKIDLDDEFQNALMGNLFNVVESMGEAFEGLE